MQQSISITLTKGDEKKHSVIYTSDQPKITFYVPKEGVLGSKPYPSYILCTLEPKP